MFGRVNVPPGSAHYEAKYKYETKMDKYKYARDRKDPAHLGDIAVGDEDQDITRADVEAYQKMYESKYSFSAVVRVSYVIIGGLCGALIGTLVGTIAFQGNNIDLRYVMWGLLIGALSGCLILFTILYVNYYMNNKFDKEQAARREALRRKEQQTLERHDEFVYYDGAREQGFCYRLICCPHFGKITSERVIYSHDGEKYWECTFRGFKSILTSCWTKQVEQMDYDLVLDVTVEQTCKQMCLGVGTVVLHCESAADVSMVKEERKRLMQALHDEDEKRLKSALMTSEGINALKPLWDEANAVLRRLEDERRQKCEKAGKPFKPIYVTDIHKRNSSRLIRVNDVMRPYAVMDDLSYRICKYADMKSARNINKKLDAQARNAVASGASGTT
mmetsp:Transcript_8577/g.15851  ORF Transcript_8577/g.15851 Transcript_8577/m.15851 type:complete len:389 (+) Transcript_8577:224-1390(+)|eukprot:CAMPEP_0197522072 /NCGR_PEP_ID=MMETSP1318-20131121/7260_1 /TAXON_ID=552666 /ORGANISM="Partenskyella glossopodia, Strain RCC365" /LENGTH=388 /DNA_ID=CAMNT_0043074299 /DNA_START=185 /DNA_END=1351 /DNA_ORIENTATION=+